MFCDVHAAEVVPLRAGVATDPVYLKGLLIAPLALVLVLNVNPLSEISVLVLRILLHSATVEGIHLKGFPPLLRRHAR